jgi:hypothetical protein
MLDLCVHVHFAGHLDLRETIVGELLLESRDKVLANVVL